MAVYVDDMRAPYGRLIMCHMRADTSAELVAMADTIGVARKWIQYPNTYKEHFDICLSKRAKAVEAGAIEITQRQTGLMRRERRLAEPPTPDKAGSSVQGGGEGKNGEAI